MAHRPSETLFQTACDLCKMPFPSLLRRQEPSLKRSFSCRANSRHQYENNQIFDFIKNLLFSRMHETSKALLCTGHPPARVRQISGFVKLSVCVFYSVFIPIQKSKLTRRKPATVRIVRQGEATKLGYFFGWVLQDRKHSKASLPYAPFQRSLRAFTPKHCREMNSGQTPSRRLALQ